MKHCGRGIQGIDDYAVSQTSLEQIFNGFARQQEEETSAVRGIMPQEGRCRAQPDLLNYALRLNPHPTDKFD